MRCRGWRLSVIIAPHTFDKSIQQIHLARVIYESIPRKICLSFAYSWRQQICTRIAIPLPCCREWRHGHGNRHVSSSIPINHLLPVKCLFVSRTRAVRYQVQLVASRAAACVESWLCGGGRVSLPQTGSRTKYRSGKRWEEGGRKEGERREAPWGHSDGRAEAVATLEQSQPKHLHFADVLLAMGGLKTCTKLENFRTHPSSP